MMQTPSVPRLDDLQARREEILRTVAAHGASNVRVFGSVARGDAVAESDVDFLVDMAAPLHCFAYFGALEALRQNLADLLGWEVDVVDGAALRSMREHVLREAVAL